MADLGASVPFDQFIRHSHSRGHAYFRPMLAYTSTVGLDPSGKVLEVCQRGRLGHCSF